LTLDRQHITVNQFVSKRFIIKTVLLRWRILMSNEQIFASYMNELTGMLQKFVSIGVQETFFRRRENYEYRL